MALPFSKVEKGVYIFIGYFAPLAGSLLAIAFMAMHGSKFGPHSVPVRVEHKNHKYQTAPRSRCLRHLMVDDGGSVLMDGPPESLLLAFWLLTCFQVCMLIMNLVGPCSCENRLHFPAQVVGVAADIAYLVLANHSIQFWPKGALVHDPLVYFNVSAVLMLSGQLVLAWGALRLSGSGCRPRPGALTAEDMALRERRRAAFTPVFYSDEPPDRTRVRCDYVEAHDGSSDVDILDEEAEEILSLYPHTVTSQMLQEEEYGLERAALASGHDRDSENGSEDEFDDGDGAERGLLRYHHDGPLEASSSVQTAQLPLQAVTGSRRRGVL